MRAVVITGPGGPDVLDLTEVPDPVAAPGEVVIDVAAAGVNRADLMQRRGLYPPPPGAPPYPGLECSGRIVALGTPGPGEFSVGEGGFGIGDAVCALLAGGGYAEQVAVLAGQVLPVPDGVTLTEAAALPEVACTVYANVFQRAALAPGETLLVQGGASGIGTMAIQLGKAHGARVACTAGSPAKLERCLQLGADLAVNYADDDFVAAVRDFTGGRGADVILDIMGAAYLARNLAALATGGRLVVIGMQGGSRGELDLGLLASKRASVQAATLRARPAAEKAVIVAAVREHVWPLIAARRVKPVVDRVLPLAEAPQAHRVMEAGTHTGKILLAVWATPGAGDDAGSARLGT
jgi:putative PIG3 family NAD(P)H quinone oxidoreductase